MIANILKNSWLRLLIIPYIFFFILVFSYSSYSKSIPVSYWDEILWVGRSYFFEFFIHGDFHNRIWQSGEAYDQPKLAEYFYGAWLYPLYLADKAKNPKPYDYTRFLIKNGFYEIDEYYNNTYTRYKNNSKVIKFDERMVGFPEEWVAKYGLDSLKPINLIYHARILNIFLLAGAVIIAYFLALQLGGIVFSAIFSIFYGYNSLIIGAGLKAHSEALFLFTLNAAILFMSLYFTKGRKVLYLLLFSLFSSLCMSTKLNGSFLFVIFIVSNILIFIISKEKKIAHLLSGLIPVIIGLTIFVSLNPFTYPDPIKNIQYMFDSRSKTAVAQAREFRDASIPRGQGVKKIFENFYFSEQSQYFNGIKIYEQLGSLKNYGIYLFVLFSLGIVYTLKLVFQKNVTATVILCSIITILAFMNYYLILDWGRYYAHLPLFFTLFQSFGLFSVIQYVLKYSKLLAKRPINRARKK